ncbi:Gfo/Idh/MocA family protein [Agromyces sp. MMS24-JH15]|uniref:Gfo/Idh/MocA family protein n=1 Tax=Agromyces sp. MMS24-JH15 TaxID=3243765 RepID=UPI0037491ED4
MSTTIGVGFAGAGPVTQAIHLPTIARLGGRFRPAHVMDADGGIASSVAEPSGARWSTSYDELLADPDTEVVVIASPDRFHAEQVERACAAGKRAVLCEKPLALSHAEADRIGEAAAATGVPVLVGAMHTYDPAWMRLDTDHPGFHPHTVRSDIVLTPNARSEEFASEVLARPAEHEIDPDDVRQVADHVRGIVMGLAVHDLPLVRALCPDDARPEVLRAETPPSGGYRIVARAGGVRVLLDAVKTGRARPRWDLEAWSEDASVRLAFPPPYVHAGSGVLEVRQGDVTRTVGPTARNGYEEEWRLIAGVLDGRIDPPPLSIALDDVRFAIEIADGAAEAAAAEVARRGVGAPVGIPPVAPNGVPLGARSWS